MNKHKFYSKHGFYPGEAPREPNDLSELYYERQGEAMTNDTKTKHTPGPWTVHKPAKFDQYQIEDRLIAAGNLHICEVYQYRNDENRSADGVALANARLIAAAPKLLEALYYVRYLLPKGGSARRVIEAALAEAEEASHEHQLQRLHRTRRRRNAPV